MNLYKYIVFTIAVLLYTSCSDMSYEYEDPNLSNCVENEVALLSDDSCGVLDYRLIGTDQIIVINTNERLRKYTDCAFQHLENSTLVVGKQSFDSKILLLDPYLRQCDTGTDLIFNVKLDPLSTERDTIPYAFKLPYKVSNEDLSIRFTIYE